MQISVINLKFIGSLHIHHIKRQHIIGHSMVILAFSDDLLQKDKKITYHHCSANPFRGIFFAHLTGYENGGKLM